jgi:hypothetical protein
MYDEHEDYEDDYPQQRRLPPRRLSLQWKLVVAALLVLFALGLGYCSRGPQRPPEQPVRTQTVKVVSWQDVDIRIRAAVESAQNKSVRHAETAVGQWIRELRSRTDGYCDWYFSYWNQNSMAMKAIGYHVAAALPGQQPSARDCLEQLIEEAYAARVLQPQSAQLKVEAITRESVEVYLLELSSQLSGLQAEFGVPDMEWQRHLESVSGLTLAIEGLRQVPIITKVAVVGSGVAAAKLVRVSMGHIRALVLRVTGRNLLEGGAGVIGRKVFKCNWLGVVLVAWDAADHLKVKSRNMPVLRRNLNSYLDELEQHILHDPEVGIIQTLESVQRDVLRELEETKE